MAVFQRWDKALTAIEKVLDTIAAAVMFSTMCIVVVDVFLRYFFNAPLSWSYELISLYLMVALFFFCLAPGLSAHAHVAVDLLQNKMSPRLRHFCDGVGYTFSTIVFCGIVYMAFNRSWVSWVNNDAISGSIAWPTWIAHVTVTIGSIAMVLRLLFRAVGHLVSALLGRSVIALPPLAGSGEVE